MEIHERTAPLQTEGLNQEDTIREIKIYIDSQIRRMQGDTFTIAEEVTTNTTNIATASVCFAAIITAVNAANLTCTITGVGSVTVTPIEHLGINALTGDVWPKLAATDVVSVFKLGAVYYTTFVFDDVEVCS